MGIYYEIRGKKLYTEILGDPSNTPVLLIHGGPGGIGCADFVQYQGSELSKSLYVIALDQRGVWRSEGIEEQESLRFEDMIEDFEALRQKLGIPKWSIISHSFGGYLAVLYATMYPASIQSIIYENPSFDFARSERSMLNASIHLMKNLGNTARVTYYTEQLRKAEGYQEVNSLLMQIGSELGQNGNKIMWCKEENQVIDKIAMQTKNGKEYWMRSMNTRNRLLKDGRAYTDVFNQLDRIEKPSLLIKGTYDTITDEEQIQRFLSVEKNREIIYFDNSGHYARIEEPQKYAKTVVDFIQSHRYHI